MGIVSAQACECLANSRPSQAIYAGRKEFESNLNLLPPTSRLTPGAPTEIESAFFPPLWQLGVAEWQPSACGVKAENVNCCQLLRGAFEQTDGACSGHAGSFDSEDTGTATDARLGDCTAYSSDVR